jgi:hypothetical protein
MSKTKYRTASQLGITEDERKYAMRAALFLLRMEPGEVRKVPRNGTFKFDMPNWLKSDPAPGCDTAGCIKGLMVTLAKTDGKMLYMGPDSHSQSIDWLFFGAIAGSPRSFASVTPREAAHATLRFLQTGKVSYYDFRVPQA